MSLGRRRVPGWLPLTVLFSGALLLRLFLAFVVFPDSGHRSDLGILTDWAHELAANGPGAFYRPDSGYFADYPPVYLYILWLTGVVGRWWSTVFGGQDVTPAMIKLPFILADLGAGAFVLLLGRRLFGERAGLIGAVAFLFNPAVILVSTIWAQNDSIATMAVVAAAWLLVTGRTEGAAAVAVVAMLVKFQYGFFVPVVAVVGLKRHLLGVSSDATLDRRPEPFRVLLALVVAAAALVVTCWPFGMVPFDPGHPSYSLFHRFLGAAGAFPGVTQNAFNLWMNPFFDIVRVGSSGLTEGHVVDDAVAVLSIGGVSLTWQWIGNLLFIGAVAVALLVLRRRDDGPAIVFVALTIAVAFFALPTRVHERYLYPALALGIPFLAVRSWRWLCVALSAIAFLDVYWVYSLPIGNAGPGRGILGPTVYSPAGIYFLSAVTVIAMVWLLAKALDPIGLPWGVATPSRATQLERDVWTSGGADVDEAAKTSGGAGRDLGAGLAAAVGRLAGPLGALDRRLVGRAPSGARTFLGIALLSFVAAMVAARVGGGGGPWLWNLDLPKIHAPLASLYHDALAAGRLPLWNDRLGLGFPLYAEGQIGAFYPPNWLIFRLPPLVALDVTRVFHLTLAGAGTGLLALRLTGSRAGALAAAVTAVLGGAIATKLEWHNLVAAYGWLPWVLVPLIRRPSPTRGGLVAAGVLWGVQALAGHPNMWLLTGLTAAIIMLATAPRAATLGRIAGFGGLGLAVGAVQLIPTAILTTLSVRSVALSRADLFTSAATPFDILGFGFANPFAKTGLDGSWNLASVWYPDGAFALFEAGAFVGLPILALAAVGLAPRRTRPIVAAILAMLAIPIVAAFQPDPWTVIPFLNGLRSPVRSYVVVAVLLGVLAAFGIGRLGRVGRPGGDMEGRLGSARRRAAMAVGVLVAAYLGYLALAVLLPSVFEQLILAASTFLGPAEVGSRRELAIAALTAPWPFVAEVLLGALAVLVVFAARVVPNARRSLALIALAVAAIPLALLSRAPNTLRPATDFSFANTPFVQAAKEAGAHRLLTIGEPGWYAGMPDQLAAAGVPDIRMFSSLDFIETDRLLASLHDRDSTGELRRAVGVDVVVTFDKPCPGRTIGRVAEDRATICRIDDALRPPYWIPARDASIAVPADTGSAIRPREATIALRATLDDARAMSVSRFDPGALAATVDAPADGWVWIDRAWWPAWQTTIDGRSVTPLRAFAGQLVPVTAGRHEIVQTLVPWEAYLGAAVGLLAICTGGAWIWLGSELRRRKPTDPR